MTRFHHFKEECIVRCLYCSRELLPQSWESSHVGWRHYKTAKCECGKTLRVEADFDGSGHDSWAQKIFEMHGLEGRVVIESKNK